MTTVYDAHSAAAYGTIGFLPLIGALIAQSIPDSATEVERWGQLTAAAMIGVVFLWLIMKYLPAREQRAEERQDERDKAHSAAIKELQESFAATLARQLDMSKESAKSGHEALQNLVREQHQMTMAIEKNTEAVRQVCNRLEHEHR